MSSKAWLHAANVIGNTAALALRLGQGDIRLWAVALHLMFIIGSTVFWADEMRSKGNRR